MTNRIIKRPEVSHKTGLARSTIYTLVAQGKFPKQIKLTDSRATGWLESEIDQWIDGRVANRNKELTA